MERISCTDSEFHLGMKQAISSPFVRVQKPKFLPGELLQLVGAVSFFLQSCSVNNMLNIDLGPFEPSKSYILVW